MKKGSITIYLSLVFVSVLLLVSIIIESARMNVVQTESKSFTYLASDSVLAGYARQVYEDYGILLVWEDKSLKEQLMKYIQANINLADLNVGGTNIMATRLKDIKIEKVEYVADNGGEVFKDQILSYMKYAIATKSVNKLIDLYSSNSNNQEESDTSEYMVNVKEDNSEMSELVEEINTKIKKFKEDDIKNKLKTEKKRTKFLEKINKIIEKIKKYVEEKKEFQKENKGISGNDYMDSNLIILEQIKNKIEEEQLMDSSKSKERWEQVEIEIAEKIKSLIINIPTKEDEENKGLYEKAKELIEKGILSIVVDDADNISSTSISDSNLPSKKEDSTKVKAGTLAEKATLVLYAGIKFGNYQNVKKKSDLSYELEYIIAGQDNDRSNLATVAEQMVTARNLVTLPCLVTDKVKMSELSTMSSSVATALQLPFLEPVIKGVLTEAWAFAEAVHDVKILMAGKRIDLIKNSGNWKTSLRNLLPNETKGSEKKSAIDYQKFCYLLMMKEKNTTITMRMLDMIQVNIKKNYNAAFDINQCFSGFCIKAEYETEPIFVSMPWTINTLGERIGSYSFSIKSKANY